MKLGSIFMFIPSLTQLIMIVLKVVGVLKCKWFYVFTPFWVVTVTAIVMIMYYVGIKEED